jgi:N-acetylglucosaminylphosphatidylinositol deacetylase
MLDMNPQTLVSLGFVIAAIFLFWTLSSTTTSPFARTFPLLYNKRICLLIAHPDDEAMFFAPALLALTKPELGNHIKILCLSSGALQFHSPYSPPPRRRKTNEGSFTK